MAYECGHERHNHHDNGHGRCILCHCTKFREETASEDVTSSTVSNFFTEPSSTPSYDPPSDPTPDPSPSPRLWRLRRRRQQWRRSVGRLLKRSFTLSAL